MSNNTKALQNVIVTTTDINIWSGQITLKSDDLKNVKGMPPATLVTNGSKRIIDPKTLTKLDSERRCVNRFLADLGVSTKMGYLIAPGNEGEVHRLMDEACKRFNGYKDAFLLNLNSEFRKWEDKNPDHVDMLRSNRPDVKVIANAINFQYMVYKLVPAEGVLGESSFAAMANSTASTLAIDIASSARHILKESFSDKRESNVTQKAVNVVKDLITKLRGFEMFDPRITVTADALERILSQVRSTGPLDVSEVLIIKAMLKQMTDPNTLFDYGTGKNAKIDDDSNAIQVVQPDLMIPATATTPQPVATSSQKKTMQPVFL